MRHCPSFFRHVVRVWRIKFTIITGGNRRGKGPRSMGRSTKCVYWSELTWVRNVGVVLGLLIHEVGSLSFVMTARGFGDVSYR